MGITYNPKVITDGLVFCLDAASKRSYPGTGTAWTNLVGGNNGTLTNGPTFSSDNGGSIVFDGSDDYAHFPSNSAGIQFSGDITVEVFLKPSTLSGTWNNFVTKWFGGQDWHFALKGDSGGYKLNVYTSSDYDLYANSFIPANEWFLASFTLVNGGLLTFYKNGVQDGSHSSVSRSNSAGYLRISDHRSGYGITNGMVSSVRIYNRALTADEVLQNYNTTRGRFQ
jgi:hypothetical protein